MQEKIKKKKYFTNNLIILFIVFSAVVLGITILLLSTKKYILLIVPALLFVMLIILLFIPATEYVYFCETSYFYRHNFFCKEVEIDYKAIDKIVIDFGTGLYTGTKPLSNPGSVIYFLNNKNLVHHAYISVAFIKELTCHFSKKQIKILVNLNAKIWGFPKKYHKLLYPYLSEKDKKAFVEKYGTAYTDSLNNN